MKNGEVRVITAGVDNRRRRIIYLVPIFLAAVAFGFLLELSTYEALNFAEIRSALIRFPQRFAQYPTWNKREFMNRWKGLEEQTENETKIIEVEVEVTTQERLLQFWEEPNLLDINNFTWVKNNKHLCAKASNGPRDPRIMPILVHTSRSHFQERLALRRTWGSIPIYKQWDIRFVFLIGGADRGDKPELNQDLWEQQEKELNQEQELYGDIVEGSFIDSYHNLTYKHLMGYKWVLNFCREAEFVMKIDDDMFIDIMRFLDWRSDELDKADENQSLVIPELYCHTFAGTKPIREKASKWYASVEDWPDESYPDYCSGWAYVLTVDLIQKIYSVSNNIKFFWVDDVFVTGALLEVAKKVYHFKPEIRHIWGEVSSDIREYRPLCESQNWNAKRKFKAVVYIPRGEFVERDMMCMWNKTLYDSGYQIFSIPEITSTPKI